MRRGRTAWQRCCAQRATLMPMPPSYRSTAGAPMTRSPRRAAKRNPAVPTICDPTPRGQRRLGTVQQKQPCALHIRQLLQFSQRAALFKKKLAARVRCTNSACPIGTSRATKPRVAGSLSPPHQIRVVPTFRRLAVAARCPHDRLEPCRGELRHPRAARRARAGVVTR